jgi:uncharacterized protein (TIGR03086 family)
VVVGVLENVDLGPAARRLTELITGADDAELGAPTPCPSYTLGDLIEHVGGLALAFTAAASKEGGPQAEMQPSGDASRLGHGWRTRIPRDLTALAQAWQKPGAWTGTTRIAATDTPAVMAGLAVADELVVHGWDIARATGQPYACEPVLVEAARSFLAQFASPDAPAGPDVAFGPSRELPAGAPLLDRVIALSGRDPTWEPASG